MPETAKTTMPDRMPRMKHAAIGRRSEVSAMASGADVAAAVVADAEAVAEAARAKRQLKVAALQVLAAI